jgi:hypothetical protein
MLQRVTWAVLGAVAIVGLSGMARADDGPAVPCPEAPASLPAPADPVSEERAFDREVERYLRHRAFTKRLVAERAAEREFERAVELHAAKIRLTRELSERHASAPIW